MTDNSLVHRLPTGPQAPISEPRRFAIVTIGAYGCICASFSYAFNLISEEMRSRYNLTGRDITTISTVGLVFCYFVLPYAFIYDHFGPRPIFALSTVLLPLGALLLALVFAGIVEGSVVRLSVFNAILNVGCNLFDLGCMVTVMSYFPSHKGAVVAILKSFTGLGAAIVGSIQLAFFDGKPDQYFYFLMALVFAVGAVSFFFLRLPSYHLTGYEQNHLSIEEKERKLARRAVYLRQNPPRIRFVIGIGLVILLIIFLPLQSALVAYLELGKNYKVAFAGVIIFLTLLYPTIALPLSFMENKEQRQFNELEEAGGASDRDAEQKEPVAEGDIVKLGEVVETDVDYIAPQYQGTFLHNLLTLRMWAFLWSFFCVVGSEFVIILNARFLFAALSESEVDSSLTTLLTVINGVGSAVGRLLMSYFEVWSQKRKAEDRIPITISLFFPTISVIVSLVLFLVLPKAALPLPYAIAALGNGFCAAVVVLVTRTIFAKDPAKHYNFCFLPTMASTILLNRLLYGEWYTREAEKRGVLVCYSRGCVMMPLFLLLGLVCTAFLSNAYIHIEYRRYCQKTLEERRRVREEGALQQEPLNSNMVEEMPVYGLTR
ncbi:hypothetical protein DQ04_01171120 [Trypanosoma grayi]|uniref:hypothetical protein n=1 Tax=Trypanosoma grayi TaxID=71804 RepID=UPI0004F41932|nr:hypothetical protein DQ04_01171120 [Trypanosoma grayi]KEG13179.1 hypothetical protein DQ04_01171120 [Trypanosoma grayi]